MNKVKRFLFVCTGNSCRSQMAEGWATHFGGENVRAFSAGTHPEGVRPETVTVMAEAGVDISSQRSESLSLYLDKDFDQVITLCGDARDQCPVFTGAAPQSHHGFRDPARLSVGCTTREEVLAAYREVRDEIRDFIRDLVAP